MPRPENKIILDSSPEAAKWVKVEGWFGGGRFHGPESHHEHQARYEGSTHKYCEQPGCIQVIQKGLRWCSPHKEEHDIARWKARPRAKWEGDEMVYDENTEEYFSDLDGIIEHYEERELDFAHVRLVLCEPSKYHGVDPDNEYTDILPGEDGEVDHRIMEAFNVLNKTIRELDLTASWFPGKFAVDWEPDWTPVEEPG